MTEVAVGVLVRGDGAVLLADRPAGKPYAGYWEFPGGKIEPGESIEAALARELREELDLEAGPALPWVVMEYDYPHAYVRLHFRRLFAWRGTPRALEGQHWCFHRPGQTPPAPLLPAAGPALRWIELPSACVRTPGDLDTAQAAEQWLEQALARGLRLVLWDEPRLGAQGEAILAQAAERAGAHGLRLLRAGPGAAPAAPAHGRLLAVADLRALQERPDGDWLGAVVRTRADLEAAARWGCDFALAEQAPGAAPQWPALCRDSPLPLYVAAPWSAAQLAQVRAAGGHGLVGRGLPAPAARA